MAKPTSSNWCDPKDFEASYKFDAPVEVERLIRENWKYPKRGLRLNLMMPLTVSSLSGKAEAVTINISQQGARIECEQIYAIDQRVTISCEHLPDIRSTVRWRKDANYGLVFEDTFTLREFAIAAAKVQCPFLVEDDAWPKIPLELCLPPAQAGLEIQSRAVDAVPLAGGSRTIVEDVPEMATAIRAVNFGSRVADFVIGTGAHRAPVDRGQKLGQPVRESYLVFDCTAHCRIRRR